MLRTLVKKNGGFYTIHHKEHNYHVHIFFLDYDAKLPEYFTNHHQFVWNRMDKPILNDSKLFEKQEIRWFSSKELRTKQNEFRSFYKDIVSQIIDEQSQIQSFIMKKYKKNVHNKTLKGGK
jgi:DNA-binding cell septation regulator SpoVG